MLNTCGKIVNMLRIRSRPGGDGHPQNGMSTHQEPTGHVYKVRFTPSSPVFHPPTFPQLNLTKTPLVQLYFSPLSTQPITTTTNLKNSER